MGIHFLLSCLRVIHKKLGRDIYFCMHQFGVHIDESFPVRNEFEKLSPIQQGKVGVIINFLICYIRSIFD
jgi:hypothetical protein